MWAGDIPAAWAVVLGLLTLLFGGTAGIVWQLRRDRREARAEPEALKRQRLENDQLAAGIADTLRKSSKATIDDLAGLLSHAQEQTRLARSDVAILTERVAASEHKLAMQAEAHALELEQLRDKLEQQAEQYEAELDAVRAQLTEVRSVAARFRGRVEQWLLERGADLPDWWHTEA